MQFVLFGLFKLVNSTNWQLRCCYRHSHTTVTAAHTSKQVLDKTSLKWVCIRLFLHFQQRFSKFLLQKSIFRGVPSSPFLVLVTFHTDYYLVSAWCLARNNSYYGHESQLKRSLITASSGMYPFPCAYILPVVHTYLFKVQNHFKYVIQYTCPYQWSFNYPVFRQSCPVRLQYTVLVL